MLRFGTNGNAKLGRGVWHISILSGVTCPGASICKAWVSVKKDEEGNTVRSLQEGKEAKLRCFSASQEIAFSTVHQNRSHNMQLLKKAGTVDKTRDLILGSLPELVSMVRVHIGGDFFSQVYFDAWMEVAAARPSTTFYAYTKSIHFWLNWLGRFEKLPVNFKMTASLGGKYDHLVDKKRMCYAQIVFHPEEAKKLGLPIEDSDDSMAQRADRPFALVLHNVQPKGTPAAEAIKRMKREGIVFGYKRDS